MSKEKEFFVRDLTIDDEYDTISAAASVMDAAKKMIDSELAGPINIGSDIEIKLVDVANKIIKIIGADSKINYKQELLFMKPLCIPDISKARNELGWMPIITIDKGLERTIYELRASKGLLGVQEAI